MHTLHVEPPQSTGVHTRGVPAARRVRGSLRLPGDKSVSHRAALLNAIAEGTSTITNFAPGADCSSTLSALRQLGVLVERDGSGVRVKGAGLRGLREPADVLDCGNSGTTMRLLCGLLAGQAQFAVLTGDASLRRRPMARVVDPLRAMGARIIGRASNRLPPLAIAPADGLRGMQHRLTVASAQVKSALLLAGLYADGPTTIHEPAPSRDHTERLLSAMGVALRVEDRRITLTPSERLPATDVVVPGDFSSAAYWLVLGCIHADAEIRVRGVGVNPTRTGLLTVLERMGANLAIENRREEAGEPLADIVARTSRLRGTTVGLELVPLTIDELPLVALLGLFAQGETVVREASELRVKESDRIAVVAEGLRSLGGDVEAAPDGWRVRPSRLHAARVESHGDHRIAMLFALAGALGEGVEIAGADAVSVSYPGFWHDLEEVTTA